mmetsp:Transcript_374/g.1288  ORF Transcript_374/g.1288 Transcript_374/m.1288 type:complete len:194 (-) Transcript_374:699-1280(-)
MLALAFATVATGASRPRLPLASGPSDVVRQVVMSGGVVGTGSLLFNLAAGRPAALRRARRWAAVSAGFSGGRATCQWVHKTDDVFARLAGACCAGALGAPSLPQVPVRVLSFAALTLLIERLEPLAEGQLRSIQLSTPGIEERRRPWRYVGNTPQAAGAARNVFGERVGEGVRPGSRLERWIESLNRELGHVQ